MRFIHVLYVAAGCMLPLTSGAYADSDDTNRLAIKVACWELKIAYDRVMRDPRFSDPNDNDRAARKLRECQQAFPNHVMWTINYGFTRGTVNP